MRWLGWGLLMIIIRIVGIGLGVLGLGNLIIGIPCLVRWVSIMLGSISMEGDYIKYHIYSIFYIYYIYIILLLYSYYIHLLYPYIYYISIYIY
jgi:hypothetical protein